MKYAILNYTLDEVIDVRHYENLPPHEAGRVLPVVEDDIPVFDSTTHKIIEGEYVIRASDVLLQWNLVELSPQEIYANKIAAGYEVSPEGFTLRLGDEDRDKFTQMLTLLRELEFLGGITDETPQTIADINGNIHTITTLRFRQIMVGYGLYYKNLWDELALAE